MTGDCDRFLLAQDMEGGLTCSAHLGLSIWSTGCWGGMCFCDSSEPHPSTPGPLLLCSLLYTPASEAQQAYFPLPPSGFLWRLDVSHLRVVHSPTAPVGNSKLPDFLGG